MTVLSPPRHRLAAFILSGVLAVGAPLLAFTAAPIASAAGDVCDICALTFNPQDCADSGGKPYDSTETNPDGTPLDSGGGSTPTTQPSSSASPTKKPTTSPSKTPTAKATSKSSGKSGTSKNSATSSPRSSGKASTTTSSSGKSTTGTSGTVTAGTTAAAGATDTAAPTDDQTEAVTTGTPEAPPAPVAVAGDQNVTVTWTAPAEGASAITGYRVELSDGNWAEVVAEQTAYTFSDLTDGDYTATVIATNALGSSAASPTSNVATLGGAASTDESANATVTALTVSGDLTLGSTVTVSGTGLPAGATGLVVEIHSTPIQLGTVDAAADGTFSLDVTIPEKAGAGDHTLVVLQDGTEIASQSIVVAAGATSSGSVSQLAGIAILVILGLAGLLALTVDALRRRNSDEADVDVVTDAILAESPRSVAVVTAPIVGPAPVGADAPAPVNWNRQATETRTASHARADVVVGR